MKALNAILILAILMVGAGVAKAQNAPLVSTRKVEGTDNVYVFRYGGHQSMFIVTSQGVIATDPISYLRPATTFKADGMEYSRPGYLSRPVCGSRGSSH